MSNGERIRLTAAWERAVIIAFLKVHTVHNLPAGTKRT